MNLEPLTDYLLMNPIKLLALLLVLIAVCLALLVYAFLPQSIQKRISRGWWAGMNH
ncbi:hypothetical protein [Spirosoma areae]